MITPYPTFKVGDRVRSKNGVQWTVIQVEHINSDVPQMSRYTVASGDTTIHNYPAYLLDQIDE